MYLFGDYIINYVLATLPESCFNLKLKFSAVICILLHFKWATYSDFWVVGGHLGFSSIPSIARCPQSLTTHNLFLRIITFQKSIYNIGP